MPPDHFMTPLSDSEIRALQDFVFLEARLADESRYEEWEALLADDVRYWVPVLPEGADPERDVSIINDNRSRVATRLRQLKTGTRHSQSPPSIMRRLLSNLEFARLGDGLLKVEANFVIYEYRQQSVTELALWPGRVEYRLRPRGGSFEIVLKHVRLLHAGGPLPSMSFLA